MRYWGQFCGDLREIVVSIAQALERGGRVDEGKTMDRIYITVSHLGSFIFFDRKQGTHRHSLFVSRGRLWSANL